MIADYHMHLENGPLTVSYVQQFVKAAQARGVDEVGISEHGHHFIGYRPVMAHLCEGDDAFCYVTEWMIKCFDTPTSTYLEVLLEAREQGMPVKIGIELDYVPGFETEIAQFVQGHPWDYVLGSVHFLGKWGIDIGPDCGWEGRDINAVYQEYFSTLQQAARSGLFDIITHPDLVKIFGHRADISLETIYRQTAQAMAEGNVCCEVSAAGLRKPVGEIYPVPELLRECCKLDVPITLSSDAHYPQDAGLNLDKAIGLAKQCGYTQLATFAQRTRTMMPLG